MEEAILHCGGGGGGNGGEAILFKSLLSMIMAFAENATAHGVRPKQVVAVNVADPTAGFILRLAYVFLLLKSPCFC